MAACGCNVSGTDGAVRLNPVPPTDSDVTCTAAAETLRSRKLAVAVSPG